MAQKKIEQTAGRMQLGVFAPEFAHLNDDILFGEVWSRNDLLSLRDRSMVTITALISQGITDSSLKIPSTNCQEQRHHTYRSSRDNYTYRFLCRLAQGLGCLQSCQRGVERRCDRR